MKMAVLIKIAYLRLRLNGGDNISISVSTRHWYAFNSHLSQEPRVEAANPGSQLQDGCQPTLLVLILNPYAHVIVERRHGEHTREDA